MSLSDVSSWLDSGHVFSTGINTTEEMLCFSHTEIFFFFNLVCQLYKSLKCTRGRSEEPGRLTPHALETHQPRVPFLFAFISRKVLISLDLESLIHSSESTHTINLLSILPKIFYAYTSKI